MVICLLYVSSLTLTFSLKNICICIFARAVCIQPVHSRLQYRIFEVVCHNIKLIDHFSKEKKVSVNVFYSYGSLLLLLNKVLCLAALIPVLPAALRECPYGEIVVKNIPLAKFYNNSK